MGAVQATTTADVWVGHGQCIEQYGSGEAYLPILEALSRLCREPTGDGILAILRQYAPSWLVHMPALLPPDDYAALRQREHGTPRERMLRELAEAVEVLSTVRPLILVLEDLHWSDVSTLDWLAYVAHRRDPARLLVLATYRPVEAIVRAHPLRAVTQELRRLGQCAERVLDYLSEAGVAAYLQWRCGGTHLPAPLVQRFHQRINGNPLFMVTIVDGMVWQDTRQVNTSDATWQASIEAALVEVPETLRQLIEYQLGQMDPDDQALLETASVAGITFTAAAVAAAMGADEMHVAGQCEALARRHLFVWSQGMTEWPDGTVTTRYGFTHALHQEVLYDRIPAGRRVRLHRHIGTRQETAYGAQAREIAAELAGHFVHGRDAWRAVPYLRYAGENAVRRSAHQEAITHLTMGLELLASLPETSERAQHELALCLALGTALIITKGQDASEVEHTYSRAREICRQVGATSQLFTVLRGLWLFYIARAEFQKAQEMAEQLLSLSQRQQAPDLLVDAHRALGATLFYRGKLAPACEYVQQGIAVYDMQQHHSRALWDSGVACVAFGAFSCWFLGYPDDAIRRGHRALTLAQNLAHPFSLAAARFWLTWLYQLRREGPHTREQAEALMALCTAQGFDFFLALGTALRGGELVIQGQREEGMVQIHQGIDTLQVKVFQPYFLALLAEAHGHAGQIDDGLRMLAEALTHVEHTGACWWEAELYRLRGELLLQQGSSDVPQAESWFQHALDVARRQQAKSLELRAVMSLSRLWRQQGKRDKARVLLGEVYHRFTEGFNTADLQEAKALLVALK